MSTNEIVVGRIGGAHGVRGWLRVTSYTESATSIFDYRPWILKTKKMAGFGDEALALDPVEWQARAKGFVVRFSGIDDRNAAERLRGADVLVDGKCLPPLEDGEYYWRDLIGLTVSVVGPDGASIGQVVGRVDRIFETGANDVMVIRRDTQTSSSNKGAELELEGAELLIPCTNEIIVDVDLDAGTMMVDWEP